MVLILFILVAVAFLAYSNGANDNFKGVATLFGSGTTNYKRALIWATITTLGGSIAALFLSEKLIMSFSGKGLVSDEVVQMSSFVASVGLGAALTVFIATVTGFPISTTHALIGALVGAGILSSGHINFLRLWEKFLIPLIGAPFISIFFTVMIYPLLKLGRNIFGIEEVKCLCIGNREEVVDITPQGTALLRSTGYALTIDEVAACQSKFVGTVLRFDAHKILNGMHYFTSGAVCFARGLNDTPKIVALLIAAQALGLKNAMVLVGGAMAIGGLLSARKVAETMSKKITKMNHEEGFAANLVTAFLVIFASRWGFPVSTTHVSCGSLFGVGLISKKADWNSIKHILLSWIITLPLAMCISGITYWVLSALG